MADQLRTGALLVFAGGYCIWKGFQKRTQAQLAQDTPTSKIRSMALGLVELKGTIANKKTVTAPLSKVPCKYYEYHVYEYRSTGKTSQWVRVATQRSADSLTLNDGTGTCTLDMKSAEIDLFERNCYYHDVSLAKGITSSKTLSFKELQKKELVTEKSVRFDTIGDYKIEEYYIEANDEIYVLGTAQNKKGKGMCITQGTNDTQFLISDERESSVISENYSKMILMCAGGVALILIGTGLLLMHFGG